MRSEKNLDTNVRRQSFARFMWSCLKWFVISFILLVAIGFTYQQITVRMNADKYPPAGEFVDVGDYTLHMYAVGEANGRPTIILESGFGTPSSYRDWEYVQDALSKYTRVISYDRAGYGWSDSAHNDRTAKQIAEDLHNLLETSGETGPFILVGHSFGGFTSQVFAQMYKEDVAGLVLIDSSHVDQEGGFSEAEVFLFRALKEVGAGHLLGLINMLPMHEHFVNDAASVHLFHRHFYNSDQVSELSFMMTESAEQVRTAQTKGYGDIPLYIFSAEHEEFPNWSALQKQMTSLSSSSEHIIVTGASHFIHIDEPQLIIDAIKECLNKIGVI